MALFLLDSLHRTRVPRSPSIQGQCGPHLVGSPPPTPGMVVTTPPPQAVECEVFSPTAVGLLQRDAVLQKRSTTMGRQARLLSSLGSLNYL